MKHYFTSDFHLNHSAIIGYTDRPFNDVEEMNSTIITNHNKIVEPEDTVYFLGDFSFGNRKEFLDKFNGTFNFIKGNHDKKPVANSVQINYGGMDINLTHRPQDAKPNFDLNLVGHVHEKWRVREWSNTILINVGVDQWDFKPVSIGDVHRILDQNDLRQKVESSIQNKGYRFYQNKSCPFFPYEDNENACHPDSNPDRHNCLFCYCPLYPLPVDKCPKGANPKLLDNGVKDCSGCLYPHRPKNYEEIINILYKMEKKRDRER